MRRTIIATILLGTGIAVAMGREAIARDKSFLVPESEFFARVHTVALQPCIVPSAFANADSLSARADTVVWRIDSLLVTALQDAGLRVVSARETKAVYDAIVDSLGGLFDESTGAADTARIAIAGRELRSRLVRDHAPDAFVFTSFYASYAEFGGGKAQWDGVSQAVTHESVGGAFAKILTLRTSDAELSGSVEALSLWIQFQGADGQWLYERGGGLQLLSTLENKRFVAIPAREYFRQPERTASAVRVALAPLSKAARKRGNDLAQDRP